MEGDREMERRTREKIKKRKKPMWFNVVGNNSPQYAWSKDILIGYNKTPIPKKITLDRNKQLIMIESGGYLKKGRPKNQYECMKNQFLAFPDIIFTFDEPPKRIEEITGKKPTLCEMREAVRISNENAKIAINIKEKFQEEYGWEVDVMAVIQSYNLSSLQNTCDYLVNLGYDMFAFGSLPTKGRTTIDKEKAVRYFRAIREIIGSENYLHLLGVFDINFLKIVKRYIDSTDASSLTRLAAYAKPYGGSSPFFDKLLVYNLKEYEKLYKKHIWNE